ncbi:hypothetical protein L208DRAFT_1161189, partial [Tricholoma matsutake]
VLSASVKEQTHENYGAGLLHFTQFCDKYNIHENLRMPASEALLCLFIANWGAGSVSKHTVSSWLSGLEMWHSINGAPWHGGRILKCTKWGVAKLVPPSSREPPCDPVSFECMVALWQHLDLSNTHDSAIWAVACMACLGELLPKSTTTFDPTCNVQWSTPIHHGTAPNNHNYLQFKIPWSKTKLAQGDWITLTETYDVVDPVTTFEHHLFVNSSCPSSSLLFSFETPAGWSPLTCTAFIDHCNSIWVACGLGAIFGHGFRIGGTTHLLLAGVDPWIVMKQGHWSLKAFLAYWHKVETILPLFIGN